jgi:hypothetical protein
MLTLPGDWRRITAFHNERELATVLAALRLWQSAVEAQVSPTLWEIASNGGTIVPLDPKQIDALCERINPDSAEAAPVTEFDLPTYRDAGYGKPITKIRAVSRGNLTLVLGGESANDLNAPDLCIERHPGGWTLQLTGQRGGDPAGHVCFMDDGRVRFMIEEVGAGSPGMEQIEQFEEIETDLAKEVS